jgi:tripartite-type tricarboxylate transporter receptor subunit TctC
MQIINTAATRRHILTLGLLLGCATTGLTGTALAQESYPSKPVRIIVPYAPGGSVDVSVRIIAQQLSAQFGKPFLIENHTGAGGNIGVNLAVEAAADGYTLLASGPNISMSPYLSKTARFDPLTSFSHVARFASDASSIGVPASSPFKTLAEMLTFAKANPGKLTYGSSGNGTPGQLAMELLKRRAGVDIRHIPYRGGALAINDVLGSQLDMIMVAASQQVPHIKSGRLRALGVTTPKRYFELPNVPSIGESFAGYESITWLGLSAPAGTPPAIVARISAEVRKALSDPAVEKRYQTAGLATDFLGAEDLTRYIANESKANERVIKDANITAD